MIAWKACVFLMSPMDRLTIWNSWRRHLSHKHMSATTASEGNSQAELITQQPWQTISLYPIRRRRRWTWLSCWVVNADLILFSALRHGTSLATKSASSTKRASSWANLTNKIRHQMLKMTRCFDDSVLSLPISSLLTKIKLWIPFWALISKLKMWLIYPSTCKSRLTSNGIADSNSWPNQATLRSCVKPCAS